MAVAAGWIRGTIEGRRGALWPAMNGALKASLEGTNPEEKIAAVAAVATDHVEAGVEFVQLTRLRGVGVRV